MEAGTAAEPQVARVYICSSGHRTLALYSVPASCNHRVSAKICGRPLVPLAEAPAESKEKMLNPLKASKKAAKKK